MEMSGLVELSPLAPIEIRAQAGISIPQPSTCFLEPRLRGDFEARHAA
jgi:hypothetical protein